MFRGITSLTFVLSILLGVGVLSGCGSEATTFEVEAIITPDPPQVGLNELEMMLRDTDGGEMAGLDLTVTPWMPIHDHGSDTEPKVEEMGQGKYHVTDLNFTMRGEWEVRISFSEDGEKKLSTLIYQVE